MESRRQFQYPIEQGIQMDGYITYPEGERKDLPAVVLAFGGNWTVGSPAQFFPQADVFSKAGYAVITPDYRVFSRQKTSPRESVSDLCCLWNYLRDHAEKFGIDRDRIALGGGSAGGHVAIMAALRTGHFPKACVLYNPIVRTSGDNFWNHQLPKDRHLFPVPPKGSNYESFADIDPMLQIKAGFPPTLLLHGRDDQEVPVEDAVCFADKLKDLGTQVRLKIYDGVGHGFFNYAKGEHYFNETNREVLRFLREYL